MSVIKSYSVGDGDMFCIRHNSNNLTIIDCCLGGRELTDFNIEQDIQNLKRSDDLCRFISTHPDEDHISGLKDLYETVKIDVFYCVENMVAKKDPSESFKYYCKCREKTKYHIHSGLSNYWLNKTNEERGASGIYFLWPQVDDQDFQDALMQANNSGEPNNISPIILYCVESGATIMWMGDLQTDFLQKIEKKIEWPKVDILFAPHHGRKSGKIPENILKMLSPQIVVIGEADSKFLDYYQGYNTITQNSAGDIMFECDNDIVHVYCGNRGYISKYLVNRYMKDSNYLHYIGSFETRRG